MVPLLLLYPPLLLLGSWIFFKLVRAPRVTLPAGNGRGEGGRGGEVICLFVCGYQGAEEDAEKLQLSDKLVQAVLAEARVCTGQPVLIAGDLNADPAVIPCLATAISEGRFVHLALVYSLGGRGRGLRLPASSSWMSVLVLVGILSWDVPMRWLLPLLAWSLIGGFHRIFPCLLLLLLMVGLLKVPALSFPSLCGPHAGLTLLTGLLHLYLVLFRMPGMCIEMNLVLYLLRLYLLCGMRCPGLRLMIFGPFGARMRRLVSLGLIPWLVVPLRLAALPFFVEVCYVVVGGVWEADLLVAGDLVGCKRATQGDVVDVHCAQYFVNSSLALVVFFRMRLKSVADVL